MARLLLGMSYLQLMDAEATGLMRDQALLAWQVQPRNVTRAIRAGSLSMSRLEQLLSAAHGEVMVEIRESVNGVVR